MPTYNNIGVALFQILDNTAAITALVDHRIYPLRSAPDARFPFIVYAVESTGPNNTKDGASITDAYEVQISIFSEAFTEATTVAETVRETLDYISHGIYNGIHVQSISYNNENDGLDDDILPDGVYVKTQTYNCRLIFS